jgi:hypothetical protein
VPVLDFNGLERDRIATFDVTQTFTTAARAATSED